MTLGLLASGPTFGGQSHTRAVYPTGIYPDDVENIQAVVDEFGQASKNGVVLLKARNAKGKPTAFNFGTSEDSDARGGVWVRGHQKGSIEFRGERRHGVMTTILGGFLPIQSTRRDRIAVRKIHFQSPQEGAIRIDVATGIEITDNVMVDIEGVRIVSNAIVIAHRELTTDFSTTITGPITIERNVIDTIRATFGVGINIQDTDSVVTARHNAISDVGEGIIVYFYRKKVVLRDNYVLTNPDPEILFPRAGLDLQCPLDEKARATVRGNTIEAPTADQIIGIFAGAFSTEQYGFLVNVPCPFQNSVIAHNEIVMPGEPAPQRFPIRLMAGDGAFSNNRIVGNRISGTPSIGITVVFAEFGTPGVFETVLDNNVFLRNKISGWTEAAALLDEFTRDNLYVGAKDDVVIDLGVDNRIKLRRRW